MSFCTAINCMDGRIQSSVINFLQTRFNAKFVDCITEPGPVRLFAKTTDLVTLNSVFTRVNISVKHHESSGIAICAHPDCAGNPIKDEVHKDQLKSAVIFLKEVFPNMEIIGLWIENNQQPQEYC